MNKIPRMMTIRQTAATGILPENTLRQMAKEGRLPCMKTGNKVLINVDKLIEELNKLGSSD